MLIEDKGDGAKPVVNFASITYTKLKSPLGERMSKRTKIVCTMGPAVSSPEMIQQLIQAGMDAARLNFSHGTHEDHQRTVDMLKAQRACIDRPLALLLDTKGPEVRLGVLKQDLVIQAGEQFELVEQACYDLDSHNKLPLTPSHIISDLKDGANILLDDGYFIASIIVKDARVKLQFQNSGVLKSRKSVNVPGAKLNLPAITDKDKDDLLFAIRNGFDWIAASFIRSADHVMQIKRFLIQHGGSAIMVAAKIENQEGVDNFDEIVQVADGIMVARGDLGVEVPLCQVPRLQKMMLRKACLAGKPAVTATQMLESMINNPRPTRAEVSDVANAIYDSSSAVMLSGETAIGKYPVETVKMMQAAIQEAEADFDYKRYFAAHNEWDFADVPSSIAMATVKTAFTSQAKAIFCSTQSGSIARLISRHRPNMRIIANTANPTVYHQMALQWGVCPVLTEPSQTLEEGFLKISQHALSKGWVEEGDLVLMTAGNPFGMAGATNIMMLECIGNVLVHAQRGVGPRIQAHAMHCTSPQPSSSVEGKIIILNTFSADYEPLIAQAIGVVLDSAAQDLQLQEDLLSCALRLSTSALVQAQGAMHAITDGMLIKLDPSRALIFEVKDNH